MSDYEQALTLIKGSLEETDFEAQPEQRIDQAERALGVRLPPTYRRFLKELGAGGVGGEEVYGLINDDFEDPRPPQTVGLTLELRREGHLSDGLIVICNLGQGSYYALDTAQSDLAGEAPVVAMTPGLNGPGEERGSVSVAVGAPL